MPTTQRASPSANAELYELAQLHGVEVAYQDAFGKRREATVKSLLRILQTLGAPLERGTDVPQALRECRRSRWRRGLEPVVLAWDGRAEKLLLRLPQSDAAKRASCRLRLENGEERRWDLDLAPLPAAEAVSLEGESYEAKCLTLAEAIPDGYHRLEVTVGKQTFEALLLAAPRRSYGGEGESPGRTWGVFLPLYALHSQHSWGAGDFTDFCHLLTWIHAQGGGVAATLPLLAAFLDEPFECSPYSPVSRLFWNEFYLNVEALPEFGQNPQTQALLASSDFRREIETLRALPQVDYRRQMALKRRILSELARTFFGQESGRRQTFERYRADHPQVEDYARFRAAGERLRTPWPHWPASPRDGAISADNYDEDARQYHLYVQWVAEEQLRHLAEEARRAGPSLYLDLPLGVHGHGYDVWRERDAFALTASGGAPPDIVFTKGQDWGFPPLHPQRIREHGYRYVRAYLRRQLAYAGVLRIDHMPVFHRLFWIPQGSPPSEGVYVRYPAQELYALFSLESHRHKTLLVGEDLGTVPPEVPRAMAQHNVQRMYVIQYEAQADPKQPLPPVPAGAVASVNTHDMPPFAAYFEGKDIAERERLGLLGEQNPEGEREKRRAAIEALIAFLHGEGRLGEEDDARSVLRACLRHLATSSARIVLVNLEDLWLETQPQNVPSTSGECANWRNKARYSLEEWQHVPGMVELLGEINRIVREG
jgi:4-alpha-glucanotransferase